MKRAALALVTLLMLVTVSAFSQSAVPQTMNFQGRLTRANGTPVLDATYPMTFTLYDALTGGNALWTQTLAATTNNGVFTVALGNGANGTQTGPLTAALFGGNRWLEIRLSNNAPLSPRQPFASVAYAFAAQTASSVPDGSLTLSKLTMYRFFCKVDVFEIAIIFFTENWAHSLQTRLRRPEFQQSIRQSVAHADTRRPDYGRQNRQQHPFGRQILLRPSSHLRQTDHRSRPQHADLACHCSHRQWPRLYCCPGQLCLCRQRDQ